MDKCVFRKFYYHSNIDLFFDSVAGDPQISIRQRTQPVELSGSLT